jgi:hypothetical protein
LGCLALLGRLAFLLACQAVTVAVTVHATNPFLQGVSARNQVIMVQQCQAFAAGGGSAEASIILDPNMVTLTGHGSGMLPGKSLQRTARQYFICGAWTSCQHERLLLFFFCFSA